MWMLTPFGFFSVVQKPEDKETGMLTVRARVKGDLEALRHFLPKMPEVVSTSNSDYPYRVRVLKSDFAEATSKIVMGIDYDNFKAEVKRAQGDGRARIYTEVWATLHGLQGHISKKSHCRPITCFRSKPKAVI